VKGQAYTLFNYLVWAVFAVAFLLAAVAAYRAVVSQTASVSNVQFIKLLQQAGNSNGHCVYSDKPLYFPPGSTYSLGFFCRQMGLPRGTPIYVYLGNGLDAKGSTVVSPNGARALVAVCGGSPAKVCLGNIYPCLGGGSTGSSKISGSCP